MRKLRVPKCREKIDRYTRATKLRKKVEKEQLVKVASGNRSVNGVKKKEMKQREKME